MSESQATGIAATSGTTDITVVPNDASPLLEMTGITKAFAGVPALVGASLTVRRSEVHALVGQNGAGKSTLIKILTGAQRRDAGSITFDGRPIDFRTPQEAQRNGISTIYQEINLVPYRSVTENIVMGREPRRLGLIDWGSAHRQARDLLARLGVETDVRQPLMNLNVAMQQMVAIARALSHRVSLVVMDEPTSSLDDREVETLFETIRSLKASGVAVIFISHRLDELYALCDHVTIMRDGATVASRPIASLRKLELVATMLGKDLNEVQREGQTGFRDRVVADRQPLLAVEGIARGRALRGVSVSVDRGEIVGLAGLLGSGRTEVARAIFGADAVEGGTITLDGEAIDLSSPAAAIRAGIGFCSEDRKAEGIVSALSVRENLTLAALPVLSRNGIVDRAKQEAVVDRFIARLGIKLADADQPIRELSGGNQQKVLLARWLCLNPRLLLLDEPTRGIDVGAKAEIQSLIDELADGGLGVLMISSEIEELLEGGDRVVVLRDGADVATFSHAEVSQASVLEAMALGSAADAPDSGVVPAAAAV